MVYYKFINDSLDKRKTQHEEGFRLLRTLMREEFDADIIESDITADENGKPGFVNYRDTFFNISHCDGLCCIIVVAKNQCGIDCERIRPFRENVCRRIFTESEKKMFDSIPDNKKNEFFFILWTLKEAYGKYTGKGIADMKNVSFSFENGQLISSRPELNFRVFKKDDYIMSTCYDMSVTDLYSTKCSFGEQIY